MKRFTMGCILLLASFASLAQDYPTKPIKLIAPYAPGGSVDQIARMMAPGIGERLGTSIVIDNRPGAATLIGTRAAAQSAPDGYTLLMVSSSAVMNSFAYKNPGYSMADFEPLLPMSAPGGFILLANASLPVKTLAELIAYSKANPGKLNAGSLGPTTATNLCYERLRAASGLSSVSVNYGGSGPALQALVAGVVDVFMDGGITPLARSPQVRMLAQTWTNRATAVPDVPTLKELGFPTCGTYVAFFVPSKTPAPIVNKIRGAISQVLTSKDTIDRLTAMGIESWRGTTEDFLQFYRADLEATERDVKRAGIALD